jgi:hypothetical protein
MILSQFTDFFAFGFKIFFADSKSFSVIADIVLDITTTKKM